MALLVRSGDSNASISGSIRPFNSALEISIYCNPFRQALRTSHLAQGAAVPPRWNLTHMAAPKPGRQASCKVQPRSVLLAFEMTKSNPQHHSPVIPVGTAVLLPKGALLQSSHHLLHFLSSVFSLLHFCFHPPSSTSKKKKYISYLKKNCLLKLARQTKPIETQERITAAQKITVSLTSVQAESSH